jgi:hypothetical protein
MEITYTLSEEEIFGCFVEILSLPDAELRAKLTEYIGEAAGNLHFFRQIKPTDGPFGGVGEEAVERADERMSIILARITLLLENL